jgi:hypothetical protein
MRSHTELSVHLGAKSANSDAALPSIAPAQTGMLGAQMLVRVGFGKRRKILLSFCPSLLYNCFTAVL